MQKLLICAKIHNNKIVRQNYGFDIHIIFWLVINRSGALCKRKKIIKEELTSCQHFATNEVMYSNQIVDFLYFRCYL